MASLCPDLCLDNAWFHRARHILLRPWAAWDLEGARPAWADSSARDARTVRALQLGRAAKSAHVRDATENMLGRLPRRQQLATRAHMQLFRACLEATSLVPSDELMHAAVQVEWLWYTSPFKRFYRDHLAHVMKVATIALTLWRSEDLLVPGKLIDRVAGDLAKQQAGTEALRRAALRLGNDRSALRKEAFWKQAVLEATRLACLLHDLAYPSIMAGKYVAPAAAITDPLGPPDDERAHLAQRALAGADGHLLMLPFLEQRGDGTLRRCPAGDAAFVKLAITSHSLQAGLRILQFGAEADRQWRLSPLEAFIIEWASAAAALHDYDKAFSLHLRSIRRTGDDEAFAEFQKELEREGNQQLAAWFADAKHTEQIRPSLSRDPVSYMVALADQLQDFGRQNLEVKHPEGSDGMPPPHTWDVNLQTSLPVDSVTLARNGKRLEFTWKVASQVAPEIRQAVRSGKLGKAGSGNVEKERGAAGTVFWAPEGEQSWLDHGGLFDGITARVE